MSLISVKDLYKDAKEKKYAVGYFESWSLESTYAIVRAAEKAKSPVMIGFCGAYLCNPDREYKENLNLYGSMLKEIARNASVPVVTLLNESEDLESVYGAIKAGFDMVMFVDEKMPVDELAEINKKIVEFAHACDVAVEAEVGSLAMSDSATGAVHQGVNTDPAVAAKFVKDTGVDALAVAIGNVHLLEGKKATLDLDLLEKLADAVDAPLILHGGTGIDLEDFPEAIERGGIVKVNVGAGLKRAVINANKEYFENRDLEHMNPNDILGKGNPEDLAVCEQNALMEEVLKYIKAFNGENKAR